MYVFVFLSFRLIGVTCFAATRRAYSDSGTTAPWFDYLVSWVSSKMKNHSRPITLSDTRTESFETVALGRSLQTSHSFCTNVHRAWRQSGIAMMTFVCLLRWTVTWWNCCSRKYQSAFHFAHTTCVRMTKWETIIRGTLTFATWSMFVLATMTSYNTANTRSSRPILNTPRNLYFSE